MESPKRLVRVYVAGPYSTGSKVINVSRAMWVADVLIELGYAPYLPHLWHFQDRVYSHRRGVWMQIDLAFLSRCDMLALLPGKSAGAQEEVRLARRLGIPVVKIPRSVVRWWSDTELRARFRAALRRVRRNGKRLARCLHLRCA